MEDTPKIREVTIEEVNKYTENLFLRGKNTEQVTEELREHGLDEQTIQTVLSNVGESLAELKRAKANKDIIYGACWCLAGVVLTATIQGYIFWGAIVFGAIRFFRGVINLNNAQ